MSENKKKSINPYKKKMSVLEIKQQKFNPSEYERLGLPREEIVEIKQAFDIFDEDGSGSIDPTELKEAFEELGFKGNKKFIYNILSELDQDYTGGIEFEEFLKIATAKITDKDSKESIQKVFNMFDPKREGKITVNELKQVAQDLGEEMTEEELQKMFHKADLDDDGFVTPEDFYNIMTGKVYWNN